MEQERLSSAQQRALEVLAGHGPLGRKCVHGVCPAYLLDGRTLRGLVRLGLVVPASLAPHGPVDGYRLAMKAFTQKIFHGASNRHDDRGPTDLARAELRRQVESLMSLDSGMEQMGLACHESVAKLNRECKILMTQRRRLAKSIRTALGI